MGKNCEAGGVEAWTPAGCTCKLRWGGGCVCMQLKPYSALETMWKLMDASHGTMPPNVCAKCGCVKGYLNQQGPPTAAHHPAGLGGMPIKLPCCASTPLVCVQQSRSACCGSWCKGAGCCITAYLGRAPRNPLSCQNPMFPAHSLQASNACHGVFS